MLILSNEKSRQFYWKTRVIEIVRQASQKNNTGIVRQQRTALFMSLPWEGHLRKTGFRDQPGSPMPCWPLRPARLTPLRHWYSMSIIFRLNAGMSSGLRLLTQLPSTTTS